MLPTRLYVFFPLFAIWLWASSVFTPWVLDPDPRLWLYDVLFYLRYVLLFWGVCELVIAWKAKRLMEKKPRRKAQVTLVLLVLSAATAMVSFGLLHTGPGWHLRVLMSKAALDGYRAPAFSDQRHRAGWFLIDTRRNPCGDQSWLWLGQAYGGGSGSNVALVYSAAEAPKTPSVDAFRFWRVADHWWLAYQNPKKYYAHLNTGTHCEPGIAVDAHRKGMKFIVAE